MKLNKKMKVLAVVIVNWLFHRFFRDYIADIFEASYGDRWLI